MVLPRDAGNIIWLNGAFGAGKSAVAAELLLRLPGSVLFDPEEVGYMLGKIVPQPRGGFGFQDLPPWRPLVAHTAIELLRYVRAPLVAPMTVLRRAYAQEIFGALAAHGVRVHHVVLHADERELRRRIEAPQPGLGDAAVQRRTREWRLRHLAAYRDALPWLATDALVVDTSAQAPAQVAQCLLDRLGLGYR